MSMDKSREPALLSVRSATAVDAASSAGGAAAAAAAAPLARGSGILCVEPEPSSSLGLQNRRRTNCTTPTSTQLTATPHTLPATMAVSSISRCGEAEKLCNYKMEGKEGAALPQMQDCLKDRPSPFALEVEGAQDAPQDR